MEESELLRSEGFQVFKKIGKGALVKVYLVQHPDVGVIAAKVIQNENFEENEWTAAGVFVGDPPNTRSFIVKYIAAKKFDEMTVILMEWANIGSLIELIKTNIDIPIPVVRMIMKQILEGLRYIHSKGIIHRDIKGGNILMHCPPGSGRVVLKIADFGEAKLKAGIDQSQEITIVGTPQYMAPELFLFGNEVRVNADAKIDIWSFGIFVYLLISHTFPFKSLIYEDIRTFMINQRFERHPKIIDDQLWNLLQQMISFDPINRISAYGKSKGVLRIQQTKEEKARIKR
ncbi:MAG: putative CAMK/CAMKL/MARK protein kinase [Streblomastix strix]|uniref:Putative CAMK/CAMKL/MARK protein kinase n=1 Tax=Streblomastix strix TaxID=222440 RepID=A0A5J4V499_9EUKA|nr:MAG: putative CAMK/CAMKL/MARK protein kinase [Streblomastix strix]